jgi:hypothetical protein
VFVSQEIRATLITIAKIRAGIDDFSIVSSLL